MWNNKNGITFSSAYKQFIGIQLDERGGKEEERKYSLCALINPLAQLNKSRKVCYYTKTL